MTQNDSNSLQRFQEGSTPVAEYTDDARLLTMAQLKRKYPKTYSSWKNAVYHRVNSGRNQCDDDFRDFRKFLAALGPKPTAQHSLDRIDTSDPCYSFAKCRWATPREQANNRTSTIFLTHPESGEKKPLSEWARDLNIPADRMRRQHREGWTTEEIFEGRRFKSADRFPMRLTKEGRVRWEEDYKKRRRAGSPDGFEFRFEFARYELKKSMQQVANERSELADCYGLEYDEWPQSAKDRYRFLDDCADKFQRGLEAIDEFERETGRKLRDTDRDKIPDHIDATAISRF